MLLSIFLVLPIFALPQKAHSATSSNDFVQGISAASLASKLVTDSAISIISGTEVLKGPLAATTTYGAMDGGTLPNGKRLVLGGGISLSSGVGLPGNINNENDAFKDFQGDPDLKNVLDGAGYTSVAVTGVSALSFDFTVPAGITSINLDFLFASQESYKSNWDIAGVFVDGVNYARLPNGQILRVTSASELNSYNSPLLSGWYSWAVPQTVVGLLDLNKTTHTIKIAVADTDDKLVPSGLFLSSLRSSTQTGGGIVPISASSISPPTTFAGAGGQTFTLTYAAATGGMSNGEINVTVPAGWSGGSVTSSTGTAALAGGVIKVTGITLAEGANITITYSGVTVGTTVGANIFATSLKSTSGVASTPLVNSPKVTVKVNSTTSIASSSGNTVLFGQPIIFSSTVTSNNGTTAGAVVFQDGALTLGSVPINNGVAEFSISTLSVGSHTIKATYNGDGNNAGSSASIIINIVTEISGDTFAPVIAKFSIPSTKSSTTFSITELVVTDNVGVTGYLLSEVATPPLASDPAWSDKAPSSYTFRTWGNSTLYVFAKDAAGNISTPKTAPVYIGVKPDVDGVLIPAASKTVPDIYDALKSLNFAMNVEIPTAAEILHGDVAPLIEGIPQPDGVINLGDTIVILRRVVGL